MKSSHLKLTRNALVMALLAIVFSVGFTGCSSIIRAAYLGIQPFNDFADTTIHPRVHYERGSEIVAANIAAIYEISTAEIERVHGGQFSEYPNIYICATQACYAKYVRIADSSGETRPSGTAIVLSGQRLAANRTTEKIFLHELSHAFWFSHGVGCLPRWWSEGLAVSVSNGGGAEKRSVGEESREIRQGHVFDANRESSCLVHNSAERSGMSWQSYYRQSGMFIDFLRQYDGTAFMQLQKNLLSHVGLERAVEQSYGMTINSLWKKWIDAIKMA